MGVPTGQIQLPTTKNISELYRRDKSDPPLSPPPRNREAFSLIIKIIQTLMEKSPIFKKGWCSFSLTYFRGQYSE
jgi:hypothetical protein